MRSLATALVFLAAALSADACKWCQCLRADGAHCCVYTNHSNVDCNVVCSQVHDQSGNTCNGGSIKYKCATLPECNDRAHCRESLGCL